MEPVRLPVPGGNIVLSKRDYAIMLLVAENRFITAHEIRERFYADKKTRNHFTRIRQLVAAGVLEHVIGDCEMRLSLRLSRKGVRFLPSEIHKAYALSNRSFKYRSSFGHDKTVNQIRMVIEKSPLVSGYIPEHEVRSLLGIRHGKKESKDSGYKVPDALFDLKVPGKTLKVALEFEDSMKGVTLYRSLFRRLLISSDFDVVMFVTASEEMIAALRSIIDHVRANDPVVRDWPTERAMYFASLKQVLTEGTNAVFVGDSTPFSLASLEKQLSAE